MVGMIFHPPSLEAVDKMLFECLPLVGLLYFWLPPTMKKKILLKMSSFKWFCVNNMVSLENDEIDFVGLMLPVLPEQFFIFSREKIHERILELLFRAKKIGANLVTLGAFTSVMTDQGSSMTEHAPVCITSGNTYTAALCLESIYEVCKELEIVLGKTKVTIIGPDIAPI